MQSTTTESLSLSQNKIAELPAELADLESLETIDLSYNEFTNIPKVLFKMKQLKFISLIGNKIPRRRRKEEIETCVSQI